MAKHNEIGEIGENVVAKFLKKRGFTILDRNYNRKWGELDIIASKDGLVRFVEVKTVSRRSRGGKFEDGNDTYKPEDNMHPWKVKRLQRAIQTYLLEKYKKSEPEWQFDLACVYLDMVARVAKVKFMENIVL